MSVRLKKVAPADIRRLFNDEHYYQKALNGELRTVLMREGHPSPPLANEPFCTRSQVIAYLDMKGYKVAIVHQYLRPDGTIGLSGKPDPKKLFHKGTLYVVRA